MTSGPPLRPEVLLLAVSLGCGFPLSAQVTLQADGPGNTYELIGSKLGGSPIEVPDCGHAAFGRHITEVWDDTLGRYVFAFHIHVTPDNDRCSSFDRQRNEIKTYGPSPAYVKGFYGDVHSYRWKFKLDAGFQPSPNFTHIHQIKAGDGSDDGAPIRWRWTDRRALPDAGPCARGRRRHRVPERPHPRIAHRRARDRWRSGDGGSSCSTGTPILPPICTSRPA